MTSKKASRNRKPSRPRLPGWILLVVFLFATLLYFNTLGHGFVFDDVTLIAQNPDVAQLRWAEMLGNRSYRPVRTLTYALNFAMGGNDPWGYHLFNVLLHALNGVLLCGLVWIWTRSRWAALAAALIFVSHPVQTAAVAYISGRKDLLAAFFLLAGCLFYTYYRRGRSFKVWFLSASLISFLLAVFSKEVAIMFPLLILLIEMFVLPDDAVQDAGQKVRSPLVSRLIQVLRKAPWLYVSFTLLALLALWRVLFISQASRMVGYWGGTWLTNVGTAFKLFAHYLKLVLVPFPLVADYTGHVFPISTGLAEVWTLISLIVLLAYVAFAVWAGGKNRWISFGMFWFLACLLPVLHLIPFHEISADHFLYVPVIGVAVLAGIGVQYGVERKHQATAVCGTLIIVLGIFSAWTVIRNRDWKSPQTLWEATLKTAPESYRANSNLGTIYFAAGRREEGVRLTRKSLEIDPGQQKSWSNLGGMKFEQGKEARQQGDLQKSEQLQGEAIECLELAIEMDPQDYIAYNNLANCYKEIGQIREDQMLGDAALEARRKAYELYEKSLQLAGDAIYGQAIWLNLGILFMDAGVFDQAVFYLENFNRAFPESYEGHYWIGFCFVEQGRHERAVVSLERAARIRPNLDVFNLLARSYEAMGQTGKAIEINLRALRLQPNSLEGHFNLGVLYHRVGRLEEAVRHLEQALRLNPAGPLAPRIRRMLETLGRE